MRLAQSKVNQIKECELWIVNKNESEKQDTREPFVFPSAIFATTFIKSKR